jgi:hypothetical protein
MFCQKTVLKLPQIFCFSDYGVLGYKQCNLISGYHLFRGKYCLHFKNLYLPFPWI